MKTDHERNARIRQMREAGVPQADIATVFGLSVEAVRLVFSKFDADAAAVRRSGEMLQRFRQADDLDRKWKVLEALDSLLLMPTTRTALGRWYEWDNVEQLSLREFMNLVISERNHAKPGFLITPLLDCRFVGLRGFWSAVWRLTESDFGENCNREWRRKLERLRRASRIVGGRPYSWSKPCEPPLWLLEHVP
jgi:hypothetical protein